MYLNSTICAISTPIGTGGIAIVRVSGPESDRIARALFIPQRKEHPLKSHQMVYGKVVDPESGEMVDQILCCRMKAPDTYTREDVVEFHCHGGGVVAGLVLELCLKHGAEAAQPGEFTRRAFMAGRIDLSQAEAVAELIEAGSALEARLAAGQLDGGMKEKVVGMSSMLVELLALIEAAIDFPDEEIEIIDTLAEAPKVEQSVLSDLDRLIDAYEDGRIYREGIKLALVGRPNVGKSSLLNTLLKENKAIVTPVPGTTRDVIEARAVISGIPVDLFDTAGLESASADEVEAEGQQRARRVMAEADLVAVVLDGHRPVESADRRIYDSCDPEKSLVLANKVDLNPEMDVGEMKRRLGCSDIVRVSALTGEGIDDLKKSIYTRLAGIGPKGLKEAIPAIVPNLRHKTALEEGRLSLRRAIDAMRVGLPLEVAALEIGMTLDALGTITGKTTPEDVLEQIFSRFCLGK